MGVPAEDFYSLESSQESEYKETDQKKSFTREPSPEPALKEDIKIIAVGGGGGNALNHIIRKGIEGVHLLAVNTDARDLDMSLCDDRIMLGEVLTKGLGAGAIPEVGEEAAKETLNEIRDYLRGSDMVYIAAGMGGGTGTGAAPVIARAAKEMGILTVAVVTKPFNFEGTRKMRYAEEGIAKLRENVDALIVVPNQRLIDLAYSETLWQESFAMADEVLRQAVLGVTDLVTRPGLVNVDFADLRTVMKQAGSAVMGVGSASGEGRITKALKEALESPLMETTASGAKGVLMNITCGSDLGIFEVQEAAAYIEDMIEEDATFVWGCVEDPSMEGSVEVVVIATGFESEAAPVTVPTRRAEQIHQQPNVAPVTPTPVHITEPPAVQQELPQKRQPLPRQQSPGWLEQEEPKQEKPSQEDTIDIPTYTRRGKTPNKPQVC